jgi:hypothetical protein
VSGGFVAGVEIPIAPARAHRWRRTAVTIPLDSAERLFLLARLAGVAGTAEATLHRVDPLEGLRPAWERHQVVARVAMIVRFLRQPDATHLLIYGAIQTRVMVEAIEGNPYFRRVAMELPP